MPAEAASGPSPSYADFKLARQRGLSNLEVRAFEGRCDGEIRAAGYCGQLLALLKTQDAYDNSIVVLVSDHGETLGERQWPFDRWWARSCAMAHR